MNTPKDPSELTEKPELTEEEKLEAEAARLDAKRADREKKRRADVTRARLAGEALGDEGRDWTVVELTEGPVLLKRVPALISKRWQDACRADKVNEQTAGEYVSAAVVQPEKKVLDAWRLENPGLVFVLANAIFFDLYGTAESTRKKG